MDAGTAPTLRTLLARRELDLRPVSGEADALERPVRWVHSSDLADPTPFLSEGLVLLTTGTQFSGSGGAPGAVDAYVARLIARGVVGLGFGTRVVRAGIPPALASSCRTHGLPLFEVPYGTPFIAVARAGAEAIAAHASARSTWALGAQRAIALAALRPDGLAEGLAELARQLRAWVGLYDAAGALVREHPAGSVDRETADAVADEVHTLLRRGGRAGSALPLGGRMFTLQTLGRGGALRGVLAVASGEIDQAARGVLTSVIAMAGLALEQREGIDEARAALRTGILQLLQDGQHPIAERVSRALGTRLPEAPIVVAVTDAGAPGIRSLTAHLERSDAPTFFGVDGADLVVVTEAPGAPRFSALARRFGIRFGLSEPATHDRFARALDEARLARARGTAPVGSFGDARLTGVLAALPAEARTLAAAQLEPLRAHDADQRLVETLRAWLDHDCANEATAEALGVHRHTIRTRLGAIERLLGQDLSSFAVRAELWAALRALDV